MTRRQELALATVFLLNVGKQILYFYFYSPFHNFLPFSSLHVHWKTVRNYEKGCTLLAINFGSHSSSVFHLLWTLQQFWQKDRAVLQQLRKPWSFGCWASNSKLSLFKFLNIFIHYSYIFGLFSSLIMNENV